MIARDHDRVDAGLPTEADRVGDALPHGILEREQPCEPVSMSKLLRWRARPDPLAERPPRAGDHLVPLRGERGHAVVPCLALVWAEVAHGEDGLRGALHRRDQHAVSVTHDRALASASLRERKRRERLDGHTAAGGARFAQDGGVEGISAVGPRGR